MEEREEGKMGREGKEKRDGGEGEREKGRDKITSPSPTLIKTFPPEDHFKPGGIFYTLPL